MQTPDTAQRNLRKRVSMLLLLFYDSSCFLFVYDMAQRILFIKDAAGKKKNTPLEETAKEPSARKVKVMQFLGLASPTGSPFIPSGSISNSA